MSQQFDPVPRHPLCLPAELSDVSRSTTPLPVHPLTPFHPQCRVQGLQGSMTYTLSKPRRSGRIAAAGRKQVLPRTVEAVTAETATLRTLLSPATPNVANPVPILSVLMDPLARCEYTKRKTKYTENDVSRSQDLFTHRTLRVREWETTRQPFKQIAFLRELGTSQRYPQVKRLLENEADAREAYSVNVLSPVLEIANTFIREEHQAHFEVQIFSEYPRTVSYSKQPIRLDHLFLLVDKRLRGTGKRDLEVRIPLLGIEAKRHDLVNRDDWRSEKTGTVQMDQLNSTVEKSLSQLFMYAHEDRCSRIWFTDYFDTIACQIGLESLANMDHDVSITYAVVEDEPGRGRQRTRNVYKFGPRLALAFELFLALRDLGLVRDRVNKLDERLQAHLDRHGVRQNPVTLPLRARSPAAGSL
ncbi:uncharacterized protein JCM6883_003013 [Sporobolomyces salmoneus]|uniref:uncharacterized protein n=1 Tax=Sporobolomyces salmoneus TaxID=183962 RepID=UPI003181B390